MTKGGSTQLRIAGMITWLAHVPERVRVVRISRVCGGFIRFASTWPRPQAVGRVCVFEFLMAWGLI